MYIGGGEGCYLEEEVETEQSAAGDDGEASGVSAGDCLRHVRRVLETNI